MDIQVYYDDMEERQALVDQYNAQGFAMTQDNYDKDWQPGEEPRGTMTLTDKPDPRAPDPLAEWRQKYLLATTATAKVNVVAEFLGLEVKL